MGKVGGKQESLAVLKSNWANVCVLTSYSTLLLTLPLDSWFYTPSPPFLVRISMCLQLSVFLNCFLSVEISGSNDLLSLCPLLCVLFLVKPKSFFKKFHGPSINAIGLYFIK